ncbi:MAG: DUF2298 domain-containing protein [Candidatus Roizmanbacteria bacterium]
MEWLQSFLSWYIYVFLVGIVFYPLTKKIFSRTIDGGYAFAKIIGILLVSYIMLVLGVLRIAPFSREAIFGILILVAFVSYRGIIKGNFLEKIEKNSSLINWIVIEELIFFFGLLAWTIVRGQEPSIHGLEKFMDFGFMQSIGRSLYFPPLDMWYSADPTSPNGFAINYYYFGHLTGAVLIKLTDVYPAVGYNLILANILGLSMSAVFSIVVNMITFAEAQMGHEFKTSMKKLVMYGILGAYILNLAGNSHTLYLFTKGYPNESPLPPWDATVVADVPKLMSSVAAKFPDVLMGLQEYSKYWYPNATRFIPYTIHEFPSYSYIVADLHGHVFDIPFVLLNLAVILLVVVPIIARRYFGFGATDVIKPSKKSKIPEPPETHLQKWWKVCMRFQIPLSIFFGFMGAVHYMTNAFDGPIYLLLAGIVLFLIHRLSRLFWLNMAVLTASFFFFAAPFTLFFKPFVSGVGVNCGYPIIQSIAKGITPFKMGPFIFEKGNCQVSALYQLLILWGHFWIHAALLSVTLWYLRRVKTYTPVTATTLVVVILFVFSTALITIPEFFYIKDIYPTHFRANTMFKLGYQAYLMMSIGTVYAIWRMRHIHVRWFRILSRLVSGFFIALILIYMRFGILAYYGNLEKPVKLDGIAWLNDQYPETHDIVEYFNTQVKGQPVILEAQGDSYTDYNVVSSYTGLPTVAGWWVHQWLWRGTSDIVGRRIPDIEQIYRSSDIDQTRTLLRKYKVSYVIVSELERKKYETADIRIQSEKFNTLGREVFRSANGKAIVYQMK